MRARAVRGPAVRGPGGRSRRRGFVGLAAATLGLLLGATGCTSSHHHPAPAQPASSSPPGSLSAVEHQLLGPAPTSPALASATATIYPIQPKGLDSNHARLTAEIVQVRVDGSTTTLHWRLRSTDGSPVSASGNWASGGGSAASDTRQVAVLDPVAGLQLLPYLNVGQAVFGDGDCTCSMTPRTVSSTAVDLYGSYPALAAGTTTVTVTIPGFAPLTGVRVTRG